MRKPARLIWLLASLFFAGATIIASPATGEGEQPYGGEATLEHADPGHSQPSLFAGDVGNIVATLVTFGLVLFILGKFAWGPLLNVLQQRERSIREALEGAKREREEADKLLAEYRTQIDRAREEATAIVEEGKRDAGEVARRIQVEARQEGEQMIARARREIQLAKDTAVKELYDRTAELAIQVAGQVVGKTLSTEEHRALVAESLERMKSSGEAKLN